MRDNEELHNKILGLEGSLDNLRHEINQVSKEREQTHVEMLEKEKEKEAIAKSKNATSKHLQKLQGDL